MRRRAESGEMAPARHSNSKLELATTEHLTHLIKISARILYNVAYTPVKIDTLSSQDYSGYMVEKTNHQKMGLNLVGAKFRPISGHEFLQTNNHCILDSTRQLFSQERRLH